MNSVPLAQAFFSLHTTLLFYCASFGCFRSPSRAASKAISQYEGQGSSDKTRTDSKASLGVTRVTDIRAHHFDARWISRCASEQSDVLSTSPRLPRSCTFVTRGGFSCQTSKVLVLLLLQHYRVWERGRRVMRIILGGRCPRVDTEIHGYPVLNDCTARGQFTRVVEIQMDTLLTWDLVVTKDNT